MSIDTILFLVVMGVSTCLYLVYYLRLTSPLRILAINIAVTFALNAYAIFIWRTHKGAQATNIYVYHVLTIVQYVLYGLLFNRLFTQPLIKRLIGLSIGLFVAVALTLSFTIQPWTQYNSYAVTLFNILVPLLSGYYLWRIFVDVKVEALEREPLFWISAGLFFSSLGNFFVQGMMDYLIKNENSETLTVYWIHELMDFVLWVSFLWALYIYQRYLPKRP